MKIVSFWLGTREVELKAVLVGLRLMISAAFMVQRQVSIIQEPILYSAQSPNAVGDPVHLQGLRADDVVSGT